MLRVDVQATGTSNHDQSRVSTGEDVREMLQRRGVLREGFRRPCAECVDDHIESGEICCGQVEQILDDGVLGDGFVLPAHNSGHVKSAINGLLTMSWPDLPLAAITAMFWVMMGSYVVIHCACYTLCLIDFNGGTWCFRR